MFSFPSKSLFLASLMGLLVLFGCALTPTPPPPPAWSYYDTCYATNSSFVSMVECGKANRNASCEAANNCTSTGNAFVQYTDALALSVRNKEISEAEALRRFAEYKTKIIGDVQRNAATIAAGVAAGAAGNAPRTCIRNGNTVNCF
jgi:hypothetical protein